MSKKTLTTKEKKAKQQKELRQNRLVAIITTIALLVGSYFCYAVSDDDSADTPYKRMQLMHH